MNGLIVDLFAGGGGASCGIEMALGVNPDISINHDTKAVALHTKNHPETRHFCNDIWEVDPIEACGDLPVALLWASPDCTHFSRAKGGTPRKKNIRSLAWVVNRWAALKRPAVIILENVEEFKGWGPVRKGRPVKSQKGREFAKFVQNFRNLGYSVEWRELSACDYGAPTIRRRFFLIARCDGNAIVWPERTHGDPGSLEVSMGLLKPFRTAAEIIDWDIPAKSIFGRKKPLAEKTLERIAKGIKKFVIENPEPFVRNDSSNFLIQYHSATSKNSVRGQGLSSPMMTLDTSNRYGLVSCFLAKHYGGIIGTGINKPTGTVTTIDHHSLVVCFLQRHFGQSIGSGIQEPVGTITTGGAGKTSLVSAFLLKYYGNEESAHSLSGPIGTITTKDRFGLVTIYGQDYEIVDIGMRMLTPREQYRAQGFPEDYIIDVEVNGKLLSNSAKTRMAGNSVCPPIAAAIISANARTLMEARQA